MKEKELIKYFKLKKGMNIEVLEETKKGKKVICKGKVDFLTNRIVIIKNKKGRESFMLKDFVARYSYKIKQREL